MENGDRGIGTGSVEYEKQQKKKKEKKNETYVIYY